MGRYELISIVVPALNEAPSLRELYERARRAIGDDQPFEFIVVDDGSTDNTLDELKHLRREHRNVRILSHLRNYGKSLSIMQAFGIAQGDVAVIMDADLQDRPEMIPTFLDKLDEGYDLVNGWRTQRRDKRSRVWVSSIFNRLTAWVFKCPTHDINCGFKVMRRSVYQRLELRGDLHRLIPAMAKAKGFRIAEVAVTHSPRRFGKSRYRLLRHRGLLDIVALVAGNTTLRPFHVFSEVAMFCWLAALLGLGCWIGITLAVPEASPWFRVGQPLVGMLTTGAFFLGLMLPLFGFQLEIMACRMQDAAWRASLLHDPKNLEEKCAGENAARAAEEPQHDRAPRVSGVEEATAA